MRSMRATIRNIALGAVSIAVLTACGSQERPGADLVHPGVEGDRTVEGIDANGNGIRDDVEIFINSEYSHDPQLQEALFHIATDTQGVIDSAARAEDETEVRDNVLSTLHAESCLVAYSGFDAAADIRASLLNVIINTPDRIRAYYAADEAMSGQIVQLPADLSAGCDRSDGDAATLSGSVQSSVESLDICTSSRITNVYFGNGIRTGVSGAWKSLTAIQSAYEHVFEGALDERFVFNLAYNQTFGTMNDLREVFRQKLMEKEGWESTTEEEALEILFRIEHLQSQPLLQPEGLSPSVFVVLPQEYDAYLNAVIEVSQDIAESEREFQLVGTIQNHIQKYRAHLLAGERVIVVAHSQGNLFALHAFESLAADPLTSEAVEGMYVLSVATPADRVAANGDYVTETFDSVINGLRVLRPVLPGNYTNITWQGPFGLHHEFTGFYLRGRQTSDAIENHLKEAIRSVPYPTSEIGSGLVTITLEWDEQPDVDLHVVEPDGTHVYFGNRRGNAGYLDRDDVTGFGPEHYFISCDTVQTGIYRIGVNYYRGSAPTEYRLQVSAGFGAQVETFSRTLDRARGSSGVNDIAKPGALLTIGRAGDSYVFHIMESTGESIGAPREAP